jgi:sensor histidine kinase regulating citrate/malate metabolism
MFTESNMQTLEDQEKSRRSAQQQSQATVHEPKIVIQNLAPNQAAVNKSFQSAVLQSIDDTLIVDTNNANNQKIEEKATKKLKVDLDNNNKKRSASGASKKGSKTIKSIFQEYHQTLTTNQEQDNFTDAVTPIRFANDVDQTYCSNTSQLSMKYMLKEFTNSNHVNITSKF